MAPEVSGEAIQEAIQAVVGTPAPGSAPEGGTAEAQKAEGPRTYSEQEHRLALEGARAQLQRSYDSKIAKLNKELREYRDKLEDYEEQLRAFQLPEEERSRLLEGLDIAKERRRIQRMVRDLNEEYYSHFVEAAAVRAKVPKELLESVLQTAEVKDPKQVFDVASRLAEHLEKVSTPSGERQASAGTATAPITATAKAPPAPKKSAADMTREEFQEHWAAVKRGEVQLLE